MSQISFSPDWLRHFSDPYAVLGVSVSADDRRVLKRYRTIAKLLHPDHFASADAATQPLSNQLLAKLINPAYQKLKQSNGRADQIASLRFRVRQMGQHEFASPKSETARQLLKTPLQSVDILYEEAISSLAEFQFQPLDQFPLITEQLLELNLIYLRVKMGEPLRREQRQGIVPVQNVRPLEFVPDDAPATPQVDYAERHYQRAQEYMKKSNWSMAVQELRDAIRLQASKSQYHALLAKAYLMQNLPGMATVHFRQALKLNPKDPLALEYATKLKIDLNAPTHGAGKNGTANNGSKPDQKSGGLFGGLFARKR